MKLVKQIGNIAVKQFTNKEEFVLGFPIIHQFYGKMSEEKYRDYLDEMLEGNNYNMIGAYIDDKLIGVAGFWVLTRFYCGRYIQVGNMVVDKNYRSHGIGAIFLKFIEEEGKRRGCQKFILDSYTENKKSHNLYFREGFYIEGFHYMKDI